MAIASGTNVDISYVEEVTRGTTPGTPSMKTLRLTGKAINTQKNTLRSEEVRSDRMFSDLRHGFLQVGGSLGFELSMTAYDDMLEAVLGGSWGVGGIGQQLKVGSTLKTFTFERGFSDVTQYQVFKGVAVNSLSLNVQPEQIVGGQLGLIGMSADPLSGTSLGVPAAAATNAPFSAFDGSLSEGGSPIAIVTGVNFEIQNNRSVVPVVGSNTSPDVFEGQITITGQLTAFFEDSSLINKFINETESSLELTLDDINGSDSMLFTLPRIKYTGGDMDPPQSGPVPLTMPFEALYDSSTSTMITVERTSP